MIWRATDIDNTIDVNKKGCGLIQSWRGRFHPLNEKVIWIRVVLYFNSYIFFIII